MSDEFPLLIRQGETFYAVITEWSDEAKTIPLSNVGYSAKMQIRSTVSSEEVLLELTEGNGLTLGGLNGKTIIRIGANRTKDLIGPAVYDLRLENMSDSSDARYPVEGPVVVELRVTRDA